MRLARNFYVNCAASSLVVTNCTPKSAESQLRLPGANVAAELLGGHPNPATSGHLKTGHYRRAEA